MGLLNVLEIERHGMKHSTLWMVALLVVAGTVHGQVQVINGSFETDGLPSLEAWEWTCDDALLVNNAPVGGGQWSASKEPGHAKGCWPSYLYQRLPDLVDGEVVTLSGWMRCNDELMCIGANIGLGSLSNGFILLEETSGTMNATWTYVSITDTVEIADGDIAVVVLHAGFTGGPATFALGLFDMIGASLGTGISSTQPLRPVLYFDQASGWLHLDLRIEISGSLTVHDLTGKRVDVAIRRNSTTGVMLDLNALTSGIYFLAAGTTNGRRTVRFSMP